MEKQFSRVSTLNSVLPILRKSLPPTFTNPPHTLALMRQLNKVKMKEIKKTHYEFSAVEEDHQKQAKNK